MHRSSDLTDEASRFRQFAWEHWDNLPFAVLFRPGTYGLDRYVVKRYVEQVLSQSERWRQLSPYFASITPSLRGYTLTSYEIELMQKILDFHLNDTLHLRITSTNDQLVEYDELLDFIRRAQDYSRSHPTTATNRSMTTNKKLNIPSIPSVHSSYVLPPSAKSLIPSNSSTKSSSVKPTLSKPSTSSVITMPPALGTKSSHSLTTPPAAAAAINGHSTSHDSRQSANIPMKPNLISPTNLNQSSLSLLSEISPNALYNAKIDGSGWVQINNVFLPFIIKNRQRLVPHQVLVSCKILESDELRSTLTRATLADINLMNQMIRDCNIDNEKITEHAPLVNVYHVLIGTKNLVYVKLLPKDNPTSKINRQYKSVLALRGGSLCITCRTVPFVCSSNHSYIPLQDVLNIYPHLQTQLKPLARVPRTHEFDFLQLIQMYYDEKELPSDTLLIDMEDLNQTQIIPSKNMTLIEHHTREKIKLEQQLLLLNNNSVNANKRKNLDTHDNRQQPAAQKFKPSSNQPTHTANAGLVRPPTGYYPSSQSSASSSNSQFPPNPWLPSNYGQNGKTRWQ